MKVKLTKFEDLRIWREAHELVLILYKLSKNFPEEELYGVVSQIRRAGTSIPANIVEGFYLNTTKEFIKFLYTARGSTGEVIYFLVLCKDLGYISKDEYYKLRERYEKLARSINALINSLKKKR